MLIESLKIAFNLFSFCSIYLITFGALRLLFIQKECSYHNEKENLSEAFVQAKEA
jgi:hypothetical protein